MRKYYCPYCGKKCIDVLEKHPKWRGHLRRCPECSEILILQRTYGCLFPLVTIFVFFIVPTVIFQYVEHDKIWHSIAAFILVLSMVLVNTFLSKFSRLDGNKLDEYFDIGTIEFEKDFKFPKYHFMTESVSVLEVDGEQIPIRIEPIEIGIKSGKFKFNCIADNSRLKIDTEGKKLKVLDGERVIGYMTVEKYIPINP